MKYVLVTLLTLSVNAHAGSWYCYYGSSKMGPFDTKSECEAWAEDKIGSGSFDWKCR